MDVDSFEDIAEEFERRVQRIVWCTVSTVDRRGRPRSRILHPVWDGPTAYIGTNRSSFKAKHLAHNPYVSCSYWDAKHEMVFADCRAEWLDSDADRQAAWDFFKSKPEPYGYNPAMIWPEGLAGSDFAVLKLTPWRIELCGMQDMASGEGPRVWRHDA